MKSTYSLAALSMIKTMISDSVMYMAVLTSNTKLLRSSKHYSEDTLLDIANKTANTLPSSWKMAQLCQSN